MKKIRMIHHKEELMSNQNVRWIVQLYLKRQLRPGRTLNIIDGETINRILNELLILLLKIGIHP